jgi:hypothetical protein
LQMSEVALPELAKHWAPAQPTPPAEPATPPAEPVP